MPRPPQTLPDRLTILFDGTCDFCTWSLRPLAALDRDRRVTPVPCQAPDLIDRFPVTRAQCTHSAWAVTPDGAAYPGAEAIVLAIATARRWPRLIRLGWLPGVHALLRLGYAAVSRIRHRLPGTTSYCESHPEACIDTSST